MNGRNGGKKGKKGRKEERIKIRWYLYKYEMAEKLSGSKGRSPRHTVDIDMRLKGHIHTT